MSDPIANIIIAVLGLALGYLIGSFKRADDRRFADTLDAIESYRRLLGEARSACSAVSFGVRPTGKTDNVPYALEAFAKIRELAHFDDDNRHHLPTDLGNAMEALVSGSIAKATLTLVLESTSGGLASVSQSLHNAFQACAADMSSVRALFSESYRRIVGHE